MAMEVVMQHNTDFDFNKCPSPSRYISAPSTPVRFGEFYHSAPTSPTRLSAFYRDMLVEMGSDYSTSPATVPFDWEEKPGTPKSYNKCEDEFAFAFDVSGEMERASLSAEELFDSGVIRPIKPPPRLQHLENQYLESPTRSHKSPIKASTMKSMEEGGRGRERNATLYPSSSRHRATRSLSPLRVSEYLWEEENHNNSININKQSCVGSKPTLTVTTSALSSSSSKSYKKWSLKDLFLFRSASEGRAADKYPLKKYASLFKEVNKQSSFRSVDSTNLKRRGPVSAHELHYTMNRAVSEDLKKKTFLPYKQGILGRLAFNPAVHAIANGFGFSRRHKL